MRPQPEGQPLLISRFSLSHWKELPLWQWCLIACFIAIALWTVVSSQPTNQGTALFLRKHKVVAEPSEAKGTRIKSVGTIAVVGAGGPSGLECVRRLLAEGTRVRAVVRDPSKYAALLGAADVVQGDVTDEESLRAAFTGCQGVIFAASASNYCGKGGPYQVDYLGVQKAAAAALAVGVHHIVLISSRLVHPSNRFHPVRILLNNYRWGIMDYKWEGEEALRHSGIPYTIVRPGGLSGGEGQRPAPNPPGIEYILASGPEGDLGIAHNIHRADVAAVVCEALHSEDAKGKTIEIVARPRQEGDPSFEEHLKSIFKAIPSDV